MSGSQFSFLEVEFVEQFEAQGIHLPNNIFGFTF